MRKIIRNLGWWFFCKIGDPIFSPSQVGIGRDAVCLWCGKQHGKLTNESAWSFMLWSAAQALAQPNKVCNGCFAARWREKLSRFGLRR